VARHTYDQLIYAPNTHRLIITSQVYGAGYCGTFGGCAEWCLGKMLRYDPVAKTWSPGASPANSAHVVSSEYDPLSGMIISVGSSGIQTYDPVNDVKTQRTGSSPITANWSNLVYFPPNQKMYYVQWGSPTRIFEVTLNRATWASSSVTEVTGMSGTPNSGESGWAYDTANHIIGGGISNGVFYAYNPLNKQWDSKTMLVQGGTGSPTLYSHNLDFDPVDNVFVFYASGYHTWAYCYKRAGSDVEKSVSAPSSLLLDAAPNPFRTSVLLTLGGIPENTVWCLKAFDSRGRLIVDLTDRVKDARCEWRPVGFSGLAILQLTAGGRTAYHRILMLK
jgi:hypothetical protein